MQATTQGDWQRVIFALDDLSGQNSESGLRGLAAGDVADMLPLYLCGLEHNWASGRVQEAPICGLMPCTYTSKEELYSQAKSSLYF